MKKRKKGLARRPAGATASVVPDRANNRRDARNREQPQYPLINPDAGWRPVVCALLLVGVTLAVFWQVHRFDFLSYDDDNYVTNNRYVLSGLTFTNILWAFTTGALFNWHPLTWISHMVDCQLFGLNAGAHHLVNVLFHVANTLLLFEIFRRATRALWRSGLAAALFAIHPLHVQSVAWVSERKDVLSAFFALLAIAGYCVYTRRPTVRRYLLVVIPFVLGLMAKSMIVTLPCVLLLLDFWPLGRFKPDKLGDGTRLVLEKLPLFAVSAGASVIASVLMVPGTVSFGGRLSNALVSYVNYIRMGLWPSGLTMFYPHPGNSLPLWEPVAAAVFLAAVTIGAALQYRRRPYLIMGWLWYLGTLVPVIGIVSVTGGLAMADRYTYIPFIGLFLAAVWGVADLMAALRAPRFVVAAVSLAVIAAFASVAAVQTAYWRDSMTLFTHALEINDSNPIAHNNIGLLLAKKGRSEEAIAHYRKAAQELDRLGHNPGVHNNLASALDDLGKTDEAIAEYKKALEIDPDCEQTHNNLAAIFAKLGDFDKAVAEGENAVRLDPRDASAHYNLATALAQEGKTDRAIEHFREAVRLEPRDPRMHYNLAVALSSMHKIDEAGDEFLEVVNLAPNMVDAYINLGVARIMQRRYDEALKAYAKALELDPGNAKAQQDVNKLLSQAKRKDKPTDPMMGIK